MPSEAGDMKLLGNYGTIIDFVSADPNYNPANPLIAKAALATHLTAARASFDDVAAKQAPHKLAVNARQDGFEPLPVKVRGARAMLRVGGAAKNLLDDADTLVLKLTGGRKTKKIKNDPNTPADESAKQNSASQMSYDNQVGNFTAFVALLANVPAYAPNENELKLASLQALVTDLDARNKAVSTAYVALSQARGVRDQLLYLAEDSVVERAALVKAYVKAAFGSDSQLYKQIKGIAFKRAPK